MAALCHQSDHLQVGFVELDKIVDPSYVLLECLMSMNIDADSSLPMLGEASDAFGASFGKVDMFTTSAASAHMHRLEFAGSADIPAGAVFDSTFTSTHKSCTRPFMKILTCLNCPCQYINTFDLIPLSKLIVRNLHLYLKDSKSSHKHCLKDADLISDKPVSYSRLMLCGRRTAR